MIIVIHTLRVIINPILYSEARLFDFRGLGIQAGNIQCTGDIGRYILFGIGLF